MGILELIVVGLIAGLLAKLVMPGDDPGGLIVTTLIGIAGALAGGFIAGLVGFGGGGLIWTVVVATIGAVILLAIYRAIVGSRQTT